MYNVISYSVTESDNADHFIQIQIADSVQPGWIIGDAVSFDNKYTGIVRQVAQSVVNGNYITNITIGTESVFLDTVIVKGHQIVAEDLEGAVREIFGITGISANIKMPYFSFSVPLHDVPQSINGKTTVNRWIDGLTKINGSQIVNAYFDLYGNFCILPTDYVERVIQISLYSKFIESISMDSTLLHSKPEALSASPVSPDEQSESIVAEAIVNKKLDNINIQSVNSAKRVRSGAPEIDSKQYLAPTFWGSSVNIIFAGDHDIPLHTKIEMDSVEYEGLRGDYFVRKRTVNKTNGRITTEVYCAKKDDAPYELIRMRK